MVLLLRRFQCRVGTQKDEKSVNIWLDVVHRACRVLNTKTKKNTGLLKVKELWEVAVYDRECGNF